MANGFKYSNKIKIKKEDGTFDNVQISYIGPDHTTQEGIGTTASIPGQHVEGKYNLPLSETEDGVEILHIVGNGSEDSLSNAHILDAEGNATYAGDVVAQGVLKGTKLEVMDPITAQQITGLADIAYTGNYSDLDNFSDLKEYLDQVDNMINTHSQTEDPSINWTTNELKEEHIGDLWVNPNTGLTQRWNGSSWTKITDSDLQALAKSKATIFTAKPSNYTVGDLLIPNITFTVDDTIFTAESIYKCKTASTTGFNAQHWTQMSYEDDLKIIQTQVDKKAEIWNQEEDPSQSSEWGDDKEHEKDLWIQPSSKIMRAWSWIEAENKYGWIASTADLSEEWIDVIGDKASIYLSNPSVYSIADAYILDMERADANGNICSAGEILFANTDRTISSTEYNAAHWEKKVKYTDDTVANAAAALAAEAKQQAQQAIEDAAESFSLASTAEANAKSYADTKVAALDVAASRYLGLGGTTIIGDGTVISPYIAGGYLNIVNPSTQAKVIIDPNNLTKSGYIFQVHNGTSSTVGIDISGNASFSGKITATGGEVGGWTISSSALSSKDATLANTTGSYFGISGFRLGSALKYTASSDTLTITSSNFTLNYAGNIKATGADITGKITATSGKIGAFNLGDSLYSGSVTSFNQSITESDSSTDNTDSGTKGIYIGTDGLRFGADFKIYPNGTMAAGKRIYLPNGRGLRAMKSGATSISFANSNVTVWSSGEEFSDTADRYSSSIKLLNRVIFGNNNNSAATEVRSPSAIFFKCGGTSSDTKARTLIFNYTPNSATDSTAKEAFFMPGKSGLTNLGGTNYRWNYLYADHGVFTSSLKVNGIAVSLSGHTHARLTNSNGGTLFYSYSTNTIDGAKNMGYFYPENSTATSAACRLGGPDHKWGAIYSINGTIQTSDKNAKTNINIINNKYLTFFDLLEPVSYNFIDGDRTHLGYISQDVETAMTEAGLTNLDFAGFCKDTIVEEDGSTKDVYSLRYSEFIALNTAKIKQLQNVINNQQSEINTLKEQLSILNEKVDSLL